MHRTFPFIILIVAPFLRAQSTNASLAGQITDPFQALIAGAKISVIRPDTDSRFQTTTNALGQYHVANLPPGNYRIEIEKAGFKRLFKPDVILHVQDALAIDFEMTLGDTSQTITVESGTPLVNTDSATVAIVVDRMFAEHLPLNGRSFQSLILLTPGAVATPTTLDNQGQFSMNGQRTDANYFTVDGVSANFGVTGYAAMVQSASGALPALSASGGTNSLVSVDALQEFRIQTSSFAPEFGRTPGAQISIVTRSGTNDFHGTLFEYFRNDKLDARSWFVNFNKLTKPLERLNSFGGVLGGPIRRNRTFFFFSYEGLQLRQPGTMQTAVPDAASRQQSSAAIRPYVDAYPIPNGPSLGGGLAQFNAGFSNPSALRAYSLRLDHTLTSRVHVFGRYNDSPSHIDQRGPAGVLSSIQTVSSAVHTATAGITQRVTPSMDHELRVNYSNHRISTAFDLDNFGGAVPLPDSRLFPTGYTSASSAFQLAIRQTLLSKGKSGAGEQRQINLVDSLSVIAGEHHLKFGLDYRRLSPFTSPVTYTQYVQFTGVTTDPGGLLSGIANYASTTDAQGNSLLTENVSFYGQDTWKLTPRFTVTYGLRWDINPPLRGNNQANDPYTVTGLDHPATLSLAPRGTPLYKTTYGNVAPRIGLAYQLRRSSAWSTILRAGFGTFFDLGQGSLGGTSSFFPYRAVKGSASTPFPLSPENAAAPAITDNLQVSNIVVADPHLRLPRSYQWNVAFEQSLGSSQSVSLTYVGAMGRDLLRSTNLLNPNPAFQFVSVTDNSATADYHALQLRFQKRLSAGLQAVVSYALSHSIDSASTDAFATYVSTPRSLTGPNIDRGNSDFDIRHSIKGGVTYNLPYPRSRMALRGALSGWSLDACVFARAAAPDNVVGMIYADAGLFFYPRPNVNPGTPLELYGSGYAGGKVFNQAAFSAAPAGQQGNFGRNVLRGFGASQADVGVQRQFHLTETVDLNLRVESFNVLNHPNFGNPINVLSNPLFGRSTQTLANSLGSGGANGGFNPLYQIGGPRSIQLALKLQF